MKKENVENRRSIGYNRVSNLKNGAKLHFDGTIEGFWGRKRRKRRIFPNRQRGTSAAVHGRRRNGA